MTPKRIQRKRTKGWRMPVGAVYVGRPTKWGNPYYVGDPDPILIGNTLTARDAARMYEWHLAHNINPIMCYDATYPPPLDLSELRGKDLACWCPLDAPCHADVLLKWANRTEDER